MTVHTLIRVRENKAVPGWGLQYDNGNPPEHNFPRVV